MFFLNDCPPVVDAFAGAVDLTDKLRREPDELFVKDDTYYLSYSDDVTGRHSLYEILIDDLAITKYKILEQPSNTILEGTYRDFDMFDDVPLPYKINVNYKLMNQDIDINYRSIEVNNDIGSLSFAIPEDVEIVEW